jgi:hypothetical protein
MGRVQGRAGERDSGGEDASDVVSVTRKCMWVCPTCDTKNVSAYEEDDPLDLRCQCGFVILGDLKAKEHMTFEVQPPPR